MLGRQRPSTPDQLFASLPITRNLIFNDQRIDGSSRAVGPSTFSRPNKTTKPPKSEAEPVECAAENADARARRNITIPAHLDRNDWLRWLGTPGRLPPNTRRRENARRSIGGRLCATWRTRRDHRAMHINYGDCESVALTQPRRGEFGRKTVDTRGREVSRVSDE